jgi:uncharacterized protein (TIGR00730 family)
MSFIEIKQELQLSIKSVCVYCGSSNLVQEDYKKTARAVGTALAENKLKIIYGGGHVGLMGIVADAGLAAGGKVIGIIPEHIRYQEIQHDGLTRLEVVPDMHTRKRLMVEQSDAFVALPGGFGTLDEVFEIMTWKKLHLHDKAIIVYNQNGYWDPLIDLIDHMIAERFAAPLDRKLFEVVTSLDELMEALARARPAKTVKGELT